MAKKKNFIVIVMSGKGEKVEVEVQSSGIKHALSKAVIAAGQDFRPVNFSRKRPNNGGRVVPEAESLPARIKMDQLKHQIKVSAVPADITQHP